MTLEPHTPALTRAQANKRKERIVRQIERDIRNRKMAAMRMKGASLTEIARKFDLSKPRVWQVLNPRARPSRSIAPRPAPAIAA